VSIFFSIIQTIAYLQGKKFNFCCCCCCYCCILSSPVVLADNEQTTKVIDEKIEIQINESNEKILNSEVNSQNSQESEENDEDFMKYPASVKLLKGKKSIFAVFKEFCFEFLNNDCKILS
jgi:hypothetical protein